MPQRDGAAPARSAGCGADAGHACAHEHGHPTAAIDTSALVSARDICLRRNGRQLLLDVSLDIHPREIVTLIGPNGAGKTSLVRILIGLQRPDSGEVWRPSGLRIGYVPQRFGSDTVIPMTVDRFLRLGGDFTALEAERMLNEVDASTVRERQVGELSGGEMQRVLLARALLRRPQLLVLDEPVQGVDYSGEADLYNLIARLRDASGFGVLLVSHDLHIVMARSNRVVCLNHHVCCSGLPEAVAKHPAYSQLFGPEAARAFAVYRHQHDHSHDLSGMPQPAEDGPPKEDF
jgi:zinc transport system ATP-binding protein